MFDCLQLCRRVLGTLARLVRCTRAACPSPLALLNFSSATTKPTPLFTVDISFVNMKYVDTLIRDDTWSRVLDLALLVCLVGYFVKHEFYVSTNAVTISYHHLDLQRPFPSSFEIFRTSLLERVETSVYASSLGWSFPLLDLEIACTIWRRRESCL